MILSYKKESSKVNGILCQLVESPPLFIKCLTLTCLNVDSLDCFSVRLFLEWQVNCYGECICTHSHSHGYPSFLLSFFFNSLPVIGTYIYINIYISPLPSPFPYPAFWTQTPIVDKSRISIHQYPLKIQNMVLIYLSSEKANLQLPLPLPNLINSFFFSFPFSSLLGTQHNHQES